LSPRRQQSDYSKRKNTTACPEETEPENNEETNETAIAQERKY
jgi:hypothetical protein